MKSFVLIPRSFFHLVAAVALSACSTIASYDQASYEHATSLKVDTLALMDKATGSYSDNAQAIAAVNLEMEKAYEYDKGRPLDSDTVQLWDGVRTLFNAFLADWKKRGTLNSAEINDYKVGGSGSTGISLAFDQVIELESGKNKPASAAK